jgi:hypothetical protein
LKTKWIHLQGPTAKSKSKHTFFFC